MKRAGGAGGVTGSPERASKVPRVDSDAEVRITDSVLPKAVPLRRTRPRPCARPSARVKARALLSLADAVSPGPAEEHQQQQQLSATVIAMCQLVTDAAAPEGQRVSRGARAAIVQLARLPSLRPTLSLSGHLSVAVDKIQRSWRRAHDQRVAARARAAAKAKETRRRNAAVALTASGEQEEEDDDDDGEYKAGADGEDDQDDQDVGLNNENTDNDTHPALASSLLTRKRRRLRSVSRDGDQKARCHSDSKRQRIASRSDDDVDAGADADAEVVVDADADDADTQRQGDEAMGSALVEPADDDVQTTQSHGGSQSEGDADEDNVHVSSQQALSAPAMSGDRSDREPAIWSDDDEYQEVKSSLQRRATRPREALSWWELAEETQLARTANRLREERERREAEAQRIADEEARQAVAAGLAEENAHGLPLPMYLGVNNNPTAASSDHDDEAPGSIKAEVLPCIAQHIRPHQLEGIRFCWRAITCDTVVREGAPTDASPAQGCILAHAMGLGKTLQMVTLSETFLRSGQGNTVLIIVPSTVLTNWAHEFSKWIPDIALRPKIFAMDSRHRAQSPEQKAAYMEEWQARGGVMLMGLQQYGRLLTGDTYDAVADRMVATLQDPGPDLVIIDEGHQIKNAKANITKVMKLIRTMKRVCLTGYPLQNHLLEYWCMVDFVQRDLLGTMSEFVNDFKSIIDAGQHSCSNPLQKQKARRRTYVLRDMLTPVVLRRDASILREDLGTPFEALIAVRPSPAQLRILRALIGLAEEEEALDRYNRDHEIPRAQKVHRHVLAVQHLFVKVLNHPLIFKCWLMQMQRRVNNGDDTVGQQARSILASLREYGHYFDVSLNTRADGAAYNFVDTRRMLSKIRARSLRADLARRGDAPPVAGPSEPTPIAQREMQEINGQHAALVQPTETAATTTTTATTATTTATTATTTATTATTTTAAEDVAKAADLPLGLPLDPSANSSRKGKGAAVNGNGNGIGNSTAPSGRFHSLLEDEEDDDLALDDGGFDIDEGDEVTQMLLLEQLQELAGADAPLAATQRGPTSRRRAEMEAAARGVDWSAFTDIDNLDESYKMVIILQVILRARDMNDKTIVFSQSLDTLNFLQKVLDVYDIAHFRLDGDTPQDQRIHQIEEFNDPNCDRWVYLLSTKAGGLGVNLTGANRVIMTDVNWNPCHDVQGSVRAYRYGQKKQVYVYTLVTAGSMEHKMYKRQIDKRQLSHRVVDRRPTVRGVSKVEVMDLIQIEDSPCLNQVPEFLEDDKLIEGIVDEYYEYISDVRPVSELLRDDPDEVMTDEQKQAARDEFIDNRDAAAARTAALDAAGERLATLEDAEMFGIGGAGPPPPAAAGPVPVQARHLPPLQPTLQQLTPCPAGVGCGLQSIDWEHALRYSHLPSASRDTKPQLMHRSMSMSALATGARMPGRPGLARSTSMPVRARVPPSSAATVISLVDDAAPASSASSTPGRVKAERAGPSTPGRPFTNLCICVSGFSKQEKAKIAADVAAAGGQFSRTLSRQCSHLIAAKPEGDKYTYAVRWNLFVVSYSWLKNSLAQDTRLPEADFPVTP